MSPIWFWHQSNPLNLPSTLAVHHPKSNSRTPWWCPLRRQGKPLRSKAQKSMIWIVSQPRYTNYPTAYLTLKYILEHIVQIWHFAQSGKYKVLSAQTQLYFWNRLLYVRKKGLIWYFWCQNPTMAREYKESMWLEQSLCFVNHSLFTFSYSAFLATNWKR